MGNCCKAIWNLNSPYISSEGASNLKRYVYKSTDKSITYKCCMSPLANCLLRCVPLSLAQAILTILAPMWQVQYLTQITLLSFACVVLPTLLMLALYGASLRGPVPQWFCIVQGILFFVYCVGNELSQILDNIDGKQARRTGSSSPLGLLFDHACDGLVTVFVGVSLARIYYLGSSAFLLVPFVIGSYPFFLATLEEYYVGSLNLPIINGPNEGCFIILGLFLLPGVIPNSTFDSEVVKGMNIGQFASLFLAFLQLFLMGVKQLCLTISLAMIIKHSRGRRCFEVLPQLLVINLLFGTLIFLCTNTLFIQDDTAILGIFTFGFAFSKLTVAHISDTKFRPLRYLTVHLVILIFLCLGVAEALTSRRLLKPASVWPIFGFIFLVWFHMVSHVISQCCEVLHIRAFSIVKQDGGDEPCSDEVSTAFTLEPSQMFYFSHNAQKREVTARRLNSPLISNPQPITNEDPNEEEEPRPSQARVRNLQLQEGEVEAPYPQTEKNPFEDTGSPQSNYQTFNP